MTDFFSRLAERALNIAPTIQPMLAPLYAPEPQHIEDGLFDDVEELQEQNPAGTTVLPPPPDTHIQIPPVALPAIQRSSLRSTPESQTQSAEIPERVEPPHSPDRETRYEPQSYPVLERITQQSSTPRIEPPAATLTTPVTQISSQHIHEQIDNHFQQGERTLATTEPLTQTHRHNSSLEHTSNAPEKDTSLSTMSSTPTVASKSADNSPTENIFPSITRSAQTAISNKTSNSLPSIDNHYTASHHHWTQNEKPAAPTIQVTIGRIEVRATTTPTQNTTTPPRKQAAPSVMSLDDYLNQRAKGGH